MKRFLPIAFFTIFVAIFFAPVIFQGKIAIPADTIVGLYHPFRDSYAKTYPRGIPYKNFLITDPVRQQYPWKTLAVAVAKAGRLPLWNPYTFSGTPLLATMQSGFFSPMTLLFLSLPAFPAWNVQIILQTLFSGIFMFWYVRHLRIHVFGALLAGVVFAFSGFSIAWLEWGTIGQTAMWLPFLFLCVDRIESRINPFDKLFRVSLQSELRVKNQESRERNSNVTVWSILFVFSLASAFFSGHLQTFFYLYIVSLVYFLARWIQHNKSKRFLFLFLILNSCFLILTAVQWFPTLQFIQQSGRNVDQINNWQKDGWFIPWQHLVQFIAPDFFGNPATLNYWGVWNYGEFVGYVGIVPLIFALYSLFFRRDKKTLFFGSIFFLSLIFALPTFFAKLPYMLSFPFLSTAQPTRLLFLTDFSLSILAGFGLDWYLKKNKAIVVPVVFLAVFFLALWFVTSGGNNFFAISPSNLSVARHNLVFVSVMFALTTLLFIIQGIVRDNRFRAFFILCLFLLVGFDLLRFAEKFTPFTDQGYLFPNTATTAFLQAHLGNERLMSVDSRILPPNFSLIYRLQTVEGYDPLYLLRYGELIIVSERGKPDISSPFGFNRIVTPRNFDSKIIDLLGVKYILSLSDLVSPKLTKVFQEGETKVYENKNAFPRAFFVSTIETKQNKNDVIKRFFDNDFDPKIEALVETEATSNMLPITFSKGDADITKYLENEVAIRTQNPGDGFLVLTDSYYPTWHAEIDGREQRIYRTDYNFRGLLVPSGTHTIVFTDQLF